MEEAGRNDERIEEGEKGAGELKDDPKLNVDRVRPN